ncbi:MAG: phosphoribosylaminoimidazolesuccinocarboxamide synthase [Actinomycetota bacterium]|nr:phosphoribosylaminoimidazolesuccinocarboxamide synthase [Actinomycetota bacterium]
MNKPLTLEQAIAQGRKLAYDTARELINFYLSIYYKSETIAFIERLTMKLVGEVEIEGLEKIKSGKVREMFSLDNHIVIVTTDRISAFDYILPTLIPFKGILLNQISIFWFDYLKDVIKNHLLETDIDKFPKKIKKNKDMLKGRSVIVERAKIYPIECVVRGYITGSGWEEYKQTNAIGDLKLPRNLKNCSKLPEPIFTPSTKEVSGHDVSITINKAKKILGAKVVEYLKQKSLELYTKAADFALEKRDNYC